MAPIERMATWLKQHILGMAIFAISTGVVSNFLFEAIKEFLARSASSKQTTASAGSRGVGPAEEPRTDKARSSLPRIQNGLDGRIGFFFAPGMADVPADTYARLAPIAAAMADRESNVAIRASITVESDIGVAAEIAKQRAFPVRDALKALGVSDDRISLYLPKPPTDQNSPHVMVEIYRKP